MIKIVVVVVDGAGLLQPICCATLAAIPPVAFFCNLRLLLMMSMKTVSKIKALLSTWLAKMKPMMLVMLRTSDGLKLAVAIDDIDADPSCPKSFSREPSL